MLSMLTSRRHKVLSAAWEAISRSHIVVRLSPEGMITYCNDNFLRVSGYDRDEILGRLHSVVCPEGESATERYRMLWQTLREGRDHSGSYRRIAKDGSEFWLQASYSPVFNAVGGVVSILKIATDVTSTLRERADVAGKMAAIDRANMLLETDWNGTVTAANQVFLNATGFQEDEVLGQHIHEIVIFDAEAEGSRKVVKCVTDGLCANGKIEVHAADGGKLRLQATFNAIRDANGCPSKILLLASDVTAQTELESALEKAKAEASAKSTFLANMSHEVRTPMAGLMGFAELLRASDLDPEQARHVAMIIDSGEKMMQLLNDILDVSKIEENKLQIAEKPMLLRERIGQCVELMRPVAEHKGLALNLVIDDSLPEVTEGDTMRIRQVLLNLTGNAVKFTQTGSVTVRVEPCPRNARNMTIKVIDTGIGIPPAMLDKVLAKFVQADEKVTQDFGGSGLGLTISSELVRLMGGKMEIESTLDEGTTVELTLPLKESSTQECAEAGAGPPCSTNVRRSDAPRILVVEDLDINQLLIEEQMEKLGVRCDIAENGRVAIELVEAASGAGEPYRLVLMDLRMPVMDGFAAARALRTAGYSARTLPIVALTANAFEEDIAACMIAGMQGHLAKPTSLDRLSRVINEWVPVETESEGCEKPSSGGQPRKRQLQDRYLERRATVFARLADLAERNRVDETELEQLIDELHKLCGTAGLFGEERLGQIARKCEGALRAAGPDDYCHAVSEAERELRAFA